MRKNNSSPNHESQAVAWRNVNTRLNPHRALPARQSVFGVVTFANVGAILLVSAPSNRKLSWLPTAKFRSGPRGRSVGAEVGVLRHGVSSIFCGFFAALGETVKHSHSAKVTQWKFHGKPRAVPSRTWRSRRSRWSRYAESEEPRKA